MRIVAFVSQPSVIAQIPLHFRASAATAAHGGARVLPRPADRLDRAPRSDLPRPTGLTQSHSDAPMTRGDIRCARQPNGASDRSGAQGKRRSDGERGAPAAGPQAAAHPPAFAWSAIAP